MKTYEPRPNSIPERALARLRETPDEWVSGSVLAKDCSFEHKDIKNALAAAVKHGAVINELVDGVNQFKLGASVPVELRRGVGDDEEDERVSTPSVKGYGYGIGRVASVFELGAQAESAALGRDPERVTLAPAPEGCANPARFALWSDGTIDIETGTEILTLSREEAMALAKLIRGHVL